MPLEASGLLGGHRGSGTGRRVGRPGGAADCRHSHRASDGKNRRGRRTVGRRVEARHAHRQVVRNQPGRQHRAAGQERRHARVRRQVLLRGLRVRRSASRRPSARRTAIATTCRSYTDYARRDHRHPQRRQDGHPVPGERRAASSTTPMQDDDAAGEDSSPDFYWDSAARITDHGWTLEIRIPFSSLRYRQRDPQTWGIMLYRNYPRDRRYRSSRTTLPRGGNCFICSSNTLTGPLGPADRRAPGGRAVRHAPESGGDRRRRPRHASRDRAGRSRDGGIDVKWTPERQQRDRRHRQSRLLADRVRRRRRSRPTSASRSSSRRSARSSSKGVELFSTPMQAVYTRTITDPRWGVRADGQVDGSPATRRSSPRTAAAAA